MNRRKRSVRSQPPVRRNLVLLALFGIGAVALESKLAWLQLVASEDLIAEGQERQFRWVETPAHRGMFTDRHGEPLAVSTPVDSIWVDPPEISDEREGIYALAEALELDGEALERKITSNKDSRFLFIERRMSPVRAADIIELGIAGVHAQREYKRFNTMHEITCHLLGLTDIDDAGIQGLEHNFDDDLAGEPGLKLVQQDLRGRVIADVEEDRAARPGADIRLSIDMALQYPAYRELKRVKEITGASWASLAMLDIETGEVLAMANQPSCNPNDSSQRSEIDIFRNIAITDPFEPGSAIKPLILAAALENGLSSDSLITIPPEVQVGNEILTDDRANPDGDTVTNILARSSNAGMVMVTRDMDPVVIWQALKNFGLAGSTGSGLGRSEAHGALDDYKLWGSTRKDTLSYGYGLSVTTLQLARAYAAIASGGLLPPVSVVALDEPPERVRVLSTEVAADLTRMLESVISGEQATARLAAIPNYTVAGKTGTARISGPGGYSESHHRAIFAGFAPASNPRFALVVIINDPQGGEYYGGELAAPAFSRIMETALRLYGVPPDALSEQSSDTQQLTSSLAEDRQ